MMMRLWYVTRLCLSVCILCCCRLSSNAEQIVTVNNSVEEHIFTRNEISWLEDAAGKLTIEDVKAAEAKGAFKANERFYPRNYNHSSYYWFKIRVSISEPLPKKQSLIEFFDQTTDQITAYLPNADGSYARSSTGALANFSDRLYQHKNFEFLIPNQAKGDYTYYFRVRSNNQVNVIMVYRTIDRFIHYALVEYISYGLFYGMILIFCLHNLMMFVATRLKQYLYYVLYVLSVGVYEMSTDGIAFQFIWPQAPVWNEYAYGIALYSMSTFSLIFTQTLLRVKERSRVLNNVLNVTIAARTVYFIICLTVKQEWFFYKFLEFVPLSVAFITGVIIWRQGFKAARFFVLGYALLFSCAIAKLIYVLGLTRTLPGAMGHYSMSIGFVLEMVLLSFSIGDQVRLFRKEKDRAQDDAMQQMNINAQLQASINQQLEEQVAQRTNELLAQSRQIQQQAEEISRMNVLLEQDNVELKTSLDKVTVARIESAELTFEEFSQKYPDRDQCYSLLADLKWRHGYSCKKCGYENYSEGRTAFSRRCNKCTYEESAMHNTIFENNRIPINKAFYILYLMCTTKGGVSSHQISAMLNIRQSTCWSYAIRVKGIMDERTLVSKKKQKITWTDLILK